MTQIPSPAPAMSAEPSLSSEVATEKSDVIRAHVGQAFLIALGADPGSGFSWRLSAPTPSAIRCLGSAYAARTTRAGAGGEELWLFRAVEPGAVTVTLQFVRPSANGPAAMERSATFRIQISAS